MVQESNLNINIYDTDYRKCNVKEQKLVAREVGSLDDARQHFRMAVLSP